MSGTVFELAVVRISRILDGSVEPSKPPKDSPMFPQPSAPKSPLSRFGRSTPTTPPPPWPPTTPFLFTSSNGAWLMREPSRVKEPMICAYPIISDSGWSCFFGGAR